MCLTVVVCNHPRKIQAASNYSVLVIASIPRQHMLTSCKYSIRKRFH